MNKIISLNIKLALLFSISILVGGNTTEINNHQMPVSKTKLLESSKTTDSIDFYQEDDSLIFVIYLKNVTDSAIEVPINAKPFWVNKNGKHIRTVTKIHLYGDQYRSQYVSIEPNEVYKYEFVVSYLYYLDKGSHDYKLYYTNDFYNTDTDSLTIDDISNPELVTTINFTWYREEGSDKGRLISSDFKAK